MTDPTPFGEWIDRLRAGDPAAAAEFVAAFTPLLRRVVRARLGDLRLARVVDPADVCQAVLGSFFARLSAEWPPVESPNQLGPLLVAMARNRIRDEVRRHTADRRDHRRLATAGATTGLDGCAARDPSPSKAIARAELYQQVVCRLTLEERQILEDRLAGRDWSTIAAARGEPVAVLRQKLNRAVHRVRRQLVADDRRSGVVRVRIIARRRPTPPGPPPARPEATPEPRLPPPA